MQAKVSSLNAGCSHSRPASSIIRTPTAKPSFRPTPSWELARSSAAAPVPAPSILPATPSFSVHPTQRQAIITAAVSRGPAYLNFLETSQPGTDGVFIKPAQLVMSPGCEMYREQLSKGVLLINGAIPPDWMTEVHEHLNSPEVQAKLHKARADDKVERVALKKLGVPDVYEKLLHRLSQQPLLADTECTITRERVQSAEHGLEESGYPRRHPHQDTHIYQFRPVFRFPADGHSTTYLDFHIGKRKDRVARLAIEPGQGYILLPEVGCEVPGNIFTHKVPGGVDVFSLVIDCDQVTVGRQ